MRQKRFTIFAYGEGEDEKIFLRHLHDCYCRTQLISVQTGSAGGGSPKSILAKALAARRSEKRDIEFILLDTIPVWPDEVVQKAIKEEIQLIGNSPCFEALLLDIVDPTFDTSTISSRNCKGAFERLHCSGNNFNEDNCADLFPKTILNEARKRVSVLDYMIGAMEGTERNSYK